MKKTQAWKMVQRNEKFEYVVSDADNNVIALVAGQQNAERVTKLPALIDASWEVYKALTASPLTASQPEVAALGSALAGLVGEKPVELLTPAPAAPSASKTKKLFPKKLAKTAAPGLPAPSGGADNKAVVKTDSLGRERRYYGGIWKRDLTPEEVNAPCERLSIIEATDRLGYSINWLRSKSLRYWRRRGMKRNDVFMVTPKLYVMRKQNAKQKVPDWRAYLIK